MMDDLTSLEEMILQGLGQPYFIDSRSRPN